MAKFSVKSQQFRGFKGLQRFHRFIHLPKKVMRHESVSYQLAEKLYKVVRVAHIPLYSLKMLKSNFLINHFLSCFHIFIEEVFENWMWRLFEKVQGILGNLGVFVPHHRLNLMNIRWPFLQLQSQIIIGDNILAS